MTNRYVKKCSPSLDIKEIQIKATLKFQLTHKSGYYQENKQQMLERMAGEETPLNTVGRNVN
jgi:hypothetical protein